MKRSRACALLLPLLVIAAAPLDAGDPTVDPGVDLWTTPATGLSFDDFADDPIPRNFFDPDSDPFDGRVTFGGVPLPDVGPPSSPSLHPADTVVRRDGPATVPANGSEATIPIQIAALSLASPNPIVVTYDGGQNPELWWPEACLSSVAPQVPGSMTITRQCPGTGGFAGRFESTLPVRPKVIFRREKDGAVRILDPAPEIVLRFVGAHWVGEPDAALELIQVPAGAVTDGDCDGVPDPPLPGTSNFAAGVRDLSCDTACSEVPAQPQKKVLTEEEEVFARHGILPAQVPPPDMDFDGLGNDADNCPEDFNPLQQDADGDDVGDVCDNCPSVYNPCQEDSDMDGTGDACEGLVFSDGFESGDTSAWSLSIP